MSCRIPIQAKNQDTNSYLCQDSLNSSSALLSYIPTLDGSEILITKKKIRFNKRAGCLKIVYPINDCRWDFLVSCLFSNN